ncbi:MAG: hypothetical protein LBQ22_11715 [Bacteroidales bacterium]|jgi:hypothetical protein|nr:hypothetical protein [Bacteroidales bacterium]
MKKRIVYIIIGILLIAGVIFFLSSVLKKDPLIVDISDINLKVEVERFDKEFENILYGDSYKKIQDITMEYQDFFDIYNKHIIGIGSVNNASYLVYLNTFFNDYSVVEASKEVDKVFSDMRSINEDLTYSFRHIKYYYPEFEVPRIVSFIAGFNQSIVTMDGFIGIGLDKYFGEECSLYEMLDIPQYTRFEMTPEQITVDLVTALAKDRYTYEPESENLLNAMIYNGKILYFLDAIMPEFKEARKNKYTQDQLDFCYYYEKEMWTNLIENKLLFSSDYFTIRKFTENAPYTTQFGINSPPRAANWLGLQIVRSYMKHNNGVSLLDLMEDNNYQRILNLSQYSPK